jgi:5'-nucleotidase (lipoprotein e(P4) family)
MKKLFFVLVILMYACSPKLVPVDGNVPNGNIAINGKLFMTYFQQTTAEYRALCFQAYNIARLRLDQYKSSGKPPAIITDIDETVLDNSPYQAQRSLQGLDYEKESWYHWTDLALADTVPGSASFLKYAASKGFEVFYITNRDGRERQTTLRNLEKFDLPNTDMRHLILKQDISSKELRRKFVADTHDIVMLIGDNLSDFSILFDKKPVAERAQNTNLSAQEFGNRFIIIPNPVYGDWEAALYNYNYKLTKEQKDSLIRVNVKVP